MAIDHGMDPEAVEQLGRLLQRSGEQLDSIANAIDRVLRTSHWEGGDAARFLQVWPRHRNTIHQSAQGLTGLGQSALNNASEQRGASATGGGSGSGGSSPGTGVARGAALAGGLAGALSVPWAALMRMDPKRLLMINDINGTMDFARVVRKVQYSLDGRTFREMLSTTQSSSLFDKGVTVAGGAIHGYEMGQALAAGDSDAAIRRGIDIGWDVAATKHPYIAAGKTAWDVGWEVGLVIDRQTGFSDWASSGTLSHHIATTYGSAGPTPSQAAELSRRYDGPLGYGRIVLDNSAAAVSSLNPFD